MVPYTFCRSSANSLCTLDIKQRVFHDWVTFILPVTAAEIKAVLYSRCLVMACSILDIKVSILSVSRSRKLAMAVWS